MDKLFLALITLVTATLAGLFGHHPTVKPLASGQTEISTPAGEPEPTPTPPFQINSSDININDLRYPNSTITGNGNGTLTLQSSDAAAAVTDWYKQKFVSLGLNSTAIATTKSNDRVLNNLSGGNAQASVTVKISQPSASAPVSIDVTIGGPSNGVSSQIIDNVVKN